MSNTTRISLLITTCLVFALVYLLINRSFSAKIEPKHLINCDIQSAPCTQTLSDAIITLDIQPKPIRTMEELTFGVNIAGPELEKKPHIDLSMPGMDMGLNWVFLTPLGPGEYEGKGVFVKCPEDRSIWQVTVTLPETGSVHFVFDVLP